MRSTAWQVSGGSSKYRYVALKLFRYFYIRTPRLAISRNARISVQKLLNNERKAANKDQN
jgi:hypothetical protein